MIYALSDLHLALNMDKPMAKFGKIWENHPEKIKTNWNKTIRDNDIVLVSGDISWAMNMIDAQKDLDFIEKLSGKKILGYGNHDYWWNSTNKLNQDYKSIKFIKNDYYIYENFIIYIIKGSDCPYLNNKNNNKKIADTRFYERETLRLESLLETTQDLVIKNNLTTILMLHYPPTNDLLENSKYKILIDKYNIKIVIFGHIHNNYNKCLQGKIGNTEYYLTSADYLKFMPIKIK